MKTRFITIISILIMVSLACSFGDIANGEEVPGNVLFQDDFSDPSSGWDRVSEDGGITDYENGAYRIFVNSKNSDYWANPGLSFTDVVVSAEATKVGGVDDNDFGLICRYQDNQNFYFFIISSDGYYGIGKVKDGEQEILGTESMPPSESINQGNTKNNLQASCVGNQLTFSVNGKNLDKKTDADFSSGDVGLIAGSFDSAGTDIHFDNFTVINP